MSPGFSPGGRKKVVQSLPVDVTARFDDLPLTTRERLRGVSQAKIDPMKIKRPYRGGPIASVITGVIGVGLLAIWVADGGYPWSTEEATYASIFAGIVGAFLIGGALALRRRSGAPLTSFWYVHPAYLLDCHLDRVTAYPLLNLAGVNLTHHIQNGVYQYTDVALSFGQKVIHINYPGRDASVEFGRSLLAYSDQARALAKAGQLSSLPEVDLIPQELAGKAVAAPPKRWVVESLAGAALFGVVGFALLPAIQARVAENDMFLRCIDTYYYDAYSLSGCQSYIERYPDGRYLEPVDDKLFEMAKNSVLGLTEYKKSLPAGRHTADVAKAMGELYEKAISAYRAKADPSVDPNAPQGIEAMVRVITALRDNGTPTVYLKYTRAMDFAGQLGHQKASDIQADYRKDMPSIVFVPFEPAFTYDKSQEREREITDELARTFRELIPEELMKFEATEAVPPEAAVVLEIDYVAFPAPFVFTDKAKTEAHQEINFDWTFSIKFPKNAALPPYQFKMTSIPANELPEGGLYDAMARSCFSDFGNHLKGAFGFRASVNTIPPPSGAPGVPSLPGLNTDLR
jgi:hypothetical protein